MGVDVLNVLMNVLLNVSGLKPLFCCSAVVGSINPPDPQDPSRITILLIFSLSIVAFSVAAVMVEPLEQDRAPE